MAMTHDHPACTGTNCGRTSYEQPHSPECLAEHAAACAPTDLAFELYPLPPTGGMRVGMSKGVRVTHKPTGISVAVDSERSQHRNRDVALAKLSEVLVAIRYGIPPPA